MRCLIPVTLSDFEREIYDILTERGYRVLPQVPVGKFRIDMVVEGHHDNRLAIECDGDRYHGIDKWDDDMRRQRILERAGWRFWRCFASTFVMNRQDVIQDLMDTLAGFGIEPIGSENNEALSIHTEQRKITAFDKAGNSGDTILNYYP
jgi:very-short-patch-repair endonuclease